MSFVDLVLLCLGCFGSVFEVGCVGLFSLILDVFGFSEFFGRLKLFQVFLNLFRCLKSFSLFHVVFVFVYVVESGSGCLGCWSCFTLCYVVFWLRFFLIMLF